MCDRADVAHNWLEVFARMNAGHRLRGVSFSQIMAMSTLGVLPRAPDHEEDACAVVMVPGWPSDEELGEILAAYDSFLKLDRPTGGPP